MKNHLFIIATIFFCLLLLPSCGENSTDPEIAKYEALLAEWDTGFACIEEQQLKLDAAYDAWDEVYQVLPEVYPSLPYSESKTFQEVEEEVIDCRKYYYLMLAEIRITESLRAEHAPYTQKMRQAIETQVPADLPNGMLATIQEWIEPLKNTCEKYSQPLENSPDCQALYDAYINLQEQ